jgi:asparagine N-glycosylation enzyme membrane subunit Stt3
VASDKNLKTDFTNLKPEEILAKLAALRIQAWRYTNEVAGVRHVGPMAQDFKAAFGLGQDEKFIDFVDEEGVALAAIQGLNQKLDEKDAEIQTLKQQNETLEKRLDHLEQTLKSFADKN